MGVESLRGGPAETGERPGERGEVSCPGGGVGVGGSLRGGPAETGESP